MKIQVAVTANIDEAADALRELLRNQHGHDAMIDLTIDLTVHAGTKTITAPGDRPQIAFELNGPIPQPVLDYMLRNPQNKIGAIKECRAITGWGLKEAKDFVEHIADRFSSIFPARQY